MARLKRIYREGPVKFGTQRGRVRQYESYEGRGGGFLIYVPGTGSPKRTDRVKPNPATLEQAWDLINLGHRIRLRTRDGATAVFPKDSDLKAEWI